MKALQTRLALISVILLICSTLLLSWLALRSFEHDLPPEMARTVTAIGLSASDVMEKAYVNGVPLHDMVGVEEFLDTIRKDNPGIDYIIVMDARGNPLHQSSDTNISRDRQLLDGLTRGVSEISTVRADGYFDTALPLTFQHRRVGTLHVGQRASIVEDRLRETSFDVITVLVVASLIAFELLRFVLTFVISTPFSVTREFLTKIRSGQFTHYMPYDRLGGIGQLAEYMNQVVDQLNTRFHRLLGTANGHAILTRERIATRLSQFTFHESGQRQILYSPALDHIRWPFFLLIFADSLSLSFFPVFVGQFYSTDMGISKSMVIGLPISIFMFTWALSMPWAGMWSDRVGHRKAFVVGAAITTCGLILTAFAHSLYDLLLWRCITALGYGLVFLTAQSYVTNNTPPDQRTRGMAVFLSSFFAGSLSGSAIGGILSDRLGYSHTILLSAILSIASALFVLRFLHTNPDTKSVVRKKLSFNDFKLLLRNKKFVAITFLAAVPAKVALTGFLYYSAPLYLKLLGNNQSTTGRVMMAYGLAIILLSPNIAKLADKIGNLRWFVSVGGYATAASMFVIYFFDTTTGVLASITLLGIAHSIGVSPQLALINDFCKDVVQEVGAGPATGIFRLIERFGNVLGPIIAGFLITEFGFNLAFLGIGLISLICATCFTGMFFVFEKNRSHAPS
jgi:predicted MFS family arabinose efflux permease/HAMP domain-containing protein